MDPRKQRTMDALQQAAQEIFSARSVEDVTVEEIAARAGVAVGSIYNHFGSKRGLHAAVVQRALDIDRRYMDHAYTAERGPVEQLYAAAEQYLQFYLDSPEYFRMLAFPTGPGRYAAGKDLSESLARAIDEQNARMVAALRRGIADGLMRSVDPVRVATMLWSAWNGIISLAWRPDHLRRNVSELRELLVTATDVVANGLLLQQDRGSSTGPRAGGA
ncbi:TetR/AcrR family transcriptional regulator [Nocardia vermiculata]|uniref:TetR/AcrR family transcriptional regulator n=1 Tax=Nocardia vermiculata TaxID=257274 RepID=A0A846XSD8_9NOCA|nr:TetR/AcrR family transcriptional regulator [Nocardia vermiculata]NKY49527.1 TetR/AcrR family transcriptional regulator [Nocardia vermiculata]